MLHPTTTRHCATGYSARLGATCGSISPLRHKSHAHTTTHHTANQTPPASPSHSRSQKNASYTPRERAPDDCPGITPSVSKYPHQRGQPQGRYTQATGQVLWIIRRELWMCGVDREGSPCECREGGERERGGGGRGGTQGHRNGGSEPGNDWSAGGVERQRAPGGHARPRSIGSLDTDDRG